MRIFVPVVVRGEEAEGVKLWQFGKELYMDFLNLADNEDVGDFTDVMSGRDITLTTVGPEVTGTNYNKTTIMPKVKETPLAADKAEIEALLDNQPNPMEVFKKYSFEDMKQALQEHLTPEEIAKSKELVNKQIDILADQFDDIEKQVMQLKSQDQSSVIGKAKSFIK